ncbi:MAG: hypothetical protein JWP04_3072, partial [Belnapia sp.]|nr:hypothetical protein [Belnapia sp.]
MPLWALLALPCAGLVAAPLVA